MVLSSRTKVFCSGLAPQTHPALCGQQLGARVVYWSIVFSVFANLRTDWEVIMRSMHQTRGTMSSHQKQQYPPGSDQTPRIHSGDQDAGQLKA